MQINITCDNCGTVHSVKRTPEIPDWVISMGCNWCPNCEATEYYEEWYNPKNEGDDFNEPIPVGDNQLTMPFIFDEIGVPKESLTVPLK
jgi:hypothetical protein